MDFLFLNSHSYRNRILFVLIHSISLRPHVRTMLTTEEGYRKRWRKKKRRSKKQTDGTSPTMSMYNVLKQKSDYFHNRKMAHSTKLHSLLLGNNINPVLWSEILFFISLHILISRTRSVLFFVKEKKILNPTSSRFRWKSKSNWIESEYVMA